MTFFSIFNMIVQFHIIKKLGYLDFSIFIFSYFNEKYNDFSKCFENPISLLTMFCSPSAFFLLSYYQEDIFSFFENYGYLLLN